MTRPAPNLSRYTLAVASAEQAQAVQAWLWAVWLLALTSQASTTAPANPACPVAVASRPYQYDGNGNVVSANRGANLPGYTASWNAANLVQQVQNSSTQVRMAWEYDEGKSRVIERLYNASNQLGKTTYFIGGLFEEVVEATAAGNPALATQVNYRHYIQTPDGAIGIVSRSQTFSATTGLPTGNGGGINANATEKTRYWLRDHLGSVVGIADEAATLTASYRFDAWGLKSTTATYLKAGESAEERGYTGHEGLDELGLGLIHMNGRLYDPTIGRFLSADPVISEPESTQGYNRYSYVGNNPLSYMDPSGFSRWTMFRDRVLKPVVAIGIGWALGPWGFMAGQGGIFGALSGFLSSTGSVAIGVSAPGVIAATQAISAVMSGFAAGGLAGGNLRSAVRGAITAGVLQGLGELISAALQSGSQPESLMAQIDRVLKYQQGLLDHGELGTISLANADGINSFGDVPAVVSDAPQRLGLIEVNATKGSSYLQRSWDSITSAGWSDVEKALAGLPAAGAGIRIVGKVAPTVLKTTVHGAERIAGAGATRGGVLTPQGVEAARTGGRLLTQADGATVRVLQTESGRFNVVVEGERGIITTFENLSQKSLDRLGKNYGWK
jgi:RHS repeat-associated protein